MSEDKIIEKLIHLNEKMDNLVTKEEFSKFRNEITNGQDKMITILQRLDEERVHTNKWIEGIEEKADKYERNTGT